MKDLQMITDLLQTKQALSELESPAGGETSRAWGRAKVYTAPVLKAFYLTLVTHYKMLRNEAKPLLPKYPYSARCVSPTDRKSGAYAFGLGLKLDSRNLAHGYPRLSLRASPYLTASPSVDGGNREELITLPAPAKQSVEVRLTKYPPKGSLIGFKGEKSFSLPEIITTSY